MRSTWWRMYLCVPPAAGTYQRHPSLLLRWVPLVRPTSRSPQQQLRPAPSPCPQPRRSRSWTGRTTPRHRDHGAHRRGTPCSRGPHGCWGWTRLRSSPAWCSAAHTQSISTPLLPPRRQPQAERLARWREPGTDTHATAKDLRRCRRGEGAPQAQPPGWQTAHAHRVLLSAPACPDAAPAARPAGARSARNPPLPRQ